MTSLQSIPIDTTARFAPSVTPDNPQLIEAIEAALVS